VTFIVPLILLVSSNHLYAERSAEIHSLLIARKEYSTSRFVNVGFPVDKYYSINHRISLLNCANQSMQIEINGNRKFTIASTCELQQDVISHRLPCHIASTFGFSFQHTKGWNTSVRYSFLDNGIESATNVVLSRNNLPVDLNISYEIDRFSFGLSAENFMNMQWNLAHLKTQSSVRDAQTSISWDLYFPELPYALTANINIVF
jgi:hypothetical protein